MYNKKKCGFFFEHPFKARNHLKQHFPQVRREVEVDMGGGDGQKCKLVYPYNF